MGIPTSTLYLNLDLMISVFIHCLPCSLDCLDCCWELDTAYQVVERWGVIFYAKLTGLDCLHILNIWVFHLHLYPGSPARHVLSMKSSIPPSFLWRISWLFLTNTVPSLVSARTISLFFLTWGCEVISASRISAPVPRAVNEAWRPVDPKFPQWPPQVYKITIERTLQITELETSGAILDGALD